MRPTNLGFRSPKERTAEYRNPIVTFDGRALPFLQQNNHASMPKSKRFVQYEIAARRIGTTVGPGSYNIREEPLKHWNIKGTPLIRPYYAIKNPRDNGYLFVGDQMVFDPEVSRRNRRVSQDIGESTEQKSPRLGSCSTPRRNIVKSAESFEGMKNSPYLAHRLKNNPIIA